MYQYGKEGHGAWGQYNPSAASNPDQQGEGGDDDDDAWRDDSGWNSWSHRGHRKGKGRNRGGKGRGKQWRQDAEEALAGFDATTFLGEWDDSLGNSVTVCRGLERRSPLVAMLERGGKANQLSLRRDLELQTWVCGNALLEAESSKTTCLVWCAFDGRRSVWRRRTKEGEVAAGEAEDAESSADKVDPESLPSLLPWLLRPQFSDDGRKPPNIEASESSMDGARVNAILDIRQVLGGNRSAQDKLSELLTDHDLVGQEHEDCIVPSVESPLWERLPETLRRNVLHRVAAFYAAGRGEEVLIEAAQVPGETYVGRHRFLAPPRDLVELRRRWMGRTDEAVFTKAAAHVLSLYQALENPLITTGCRSNLQLCVDEREIRRGGIEYEVFASPMNAQVGNGRFGSRWPHVERLFGSAGAYPAVLEKIPQEAVVSFHPPHTPAYLDHVMTETLEKAVARFKVVHLFVPVQDAPWRPTLRRLKNASFVQSFWDNTAGIGKTIEHPVLHWTGSPDLLLPAA
mmetsp:Transcript_46449/g.85082  ORF Transcript_46449/g.85082 Transcript_46449/m.85082 type:complete len:514 (-) Transcript_46449:173-1714(-)